MAQERDELVATLEVLKRKLEKGSITKEDYEWMSQQVKKRLEAMGPAAAGGGLQPTPLQTREDVAELRRIARDQDERIEDLQQTVKELSALDSRVREFASMLAGFQDLGGLRREIEHRMALQEVKVKELLEKTIELEKYDVQALFAFMERLKGIPEEFATKIEIQETRLRQLLERASSLSEVDVKALVEGMNEMRAFAQNLIQRVEVQEKALRELYDARTETLKRSDLEGLLQSLETLREQPKMLEQKLAAQEKALKEIQEKAKMLDAAGQPERITAVKKTLDEVKRLGIDKLGARLETVDKYDESLRDLHRRLESLAKEQEVRLAILYRKVEEIPELRSALKKYTAWTAALIEEAKLAPRKLEERMGTVESTLGDFQARMAEIPGAPDLRELKEMATQVKPGVERLQSRMEEVAKEMERFKVLVDSGALPDPAELRALRAKAAEVQGQMKEVEENLGRQREEIQKRLGEAQAAVPELAERAAEVAEVTKRLMSLPPGLLERIESVGKEVEALAGAAEQRRDLEALRTTVADLDGQLRDASKRLDELPPAGVLRTLQQGLSELQGSLFGLEQKVEEERRQVVSRFEALQIPADAADAITKATALARELGDLPARMVAIEEKTATMVRQEDLESLDALVGELQELPKKIGKDLEQVRGRVKAVEEKTATAVRQEDLESLDSVVGELQELPKRVETDLEAVRGRVKELEGKAASRQEDLRALDELMKALQPLPKKVEGDLAAVARRLEAVEGALRPEEVAALKATVDEVRGLPREVEGKVEALGLRLGALEALKGGFATREQVEGLRALAEELRGLPKQVEVRAEALAQKVAALEASAGAAAARGEVEELKAAVQELRSFPKETGKSILQITQRLDSIEKRGQEAATRQEVEALRGELKEFPRQVEGRLESIGQKVAALESAAASAPGRVEFEGVKALAEELRGLPKEFEAFGRRLGSLDGRLAQLAPKEEVEGLKRIVGEFPGRLEGGLGALGGRVESLSEALAARVETLEGRSAEMSTREEEARNRMGALEGGLSTVASDLRKARAALEQAATEEEVQSVRKGAEALGGRLEGLAAEVRKGTEGLRKEFQSLGPRAAALERGLGEARSRLGSLPPVELLKRTIEEVEGLKEFPAFAEARLSELASGLESLRGREAGAEKRLDDLRKAVEPLRGRLDSVTSKTGGALKDLGEMRRWADEATRRTDTLRSELQARGRDVADLQARAGALEEAAARLAPAERVGALEEQVGRLTAEWRDAGQRLQSSLETTNQVAGLAKLAVEAGERARADVAARQSEMAQAQERLSEESARSLSRLSDALRTAGEGQARETARIEAGWKGAVAGLGEKVERWKGEGEARIRTIEGRLGAASDAFLVAGERQAREAARIEGEWKGAVAGLDERFGAWRSEATEASERQAGEHAQSLSRLDSVLGALQAQVEEARGDGRASVAEERLDALAGAVAGQREALEGLRAVQSTHTHEDVETKTALERLQGAVAAADTRQAEVLARTGEEVRGTRDRLERVETSGAEFRKEQEALAARLHRFTEEAGSALGEERTHRARLEARVAKAEEATSIVPALKEAVELTAAQLRQRGDTLGEELRGFREALDTQRHAGEATAADLARVTQGAAETARGLDALKDESVRGRQEAEGRLGPLERRVALAEGTLDVVRQRSEEGATRKELQGWGASVMEAQKGLQAHLDDQLAQVRRAQKEAADGARALESRLKEAPGEFQKAASALQQPLERRLEALEGAHRSLRDLGESRTASMERRLREISDLPARMEDLKAKQEQALDSFHQRLGALREAHQASEIRTASMQEMVEGLRREQADAARAVEAHQARSEEGRLAIERRLDQFAQQQELALQGLRNLVRASSVDVLEGRVKALEGGQDEVLHHAVGRLRTFEREVADLRELLEVLFRSRDAASIEVQERRIEGALRELKAQAASETADRGAVEARMSRLESLGEGLRAWRARQAEADETRRRAEAQERETAAMGVLLRTLADRLKVAEEGFHSMRGSVEHTLRGLADTDAKVIEDLADVKGLLGRLVELESSLRRLQAMVDARPGDVAAGLRV